MSSRTMPRRTRLASAAAVALVLSAALTACSDAELEVSDVKVLTSEGESTEDAGSATDASTPAAANAAVVAADDPDVTPTAFTVGAFQLRLPAGWSVIEGMDGAASGASGAATYSGLPAAGKDQATWLADLLAGTTEIVVAGEGVSQQPAVTLADGTEVFHVVQNYSDNRAHIFGTVKGDTLHLLRFGLDGTPEAASIAGKSVSTAVVVAPTPTPTATPAPVQPVAPTATPTASAPA